MFFKMLHTMKVSYPEGTEKFFKFLEFLFGFTGIKSSNMYETFLVEHGVDYNQEVEIETTEEQGDPLEPNHDHSANMEID